MYEFQELLSAQYVQGVKWVSLKQIKTTFLENVSPFLNFIEKSGRRKWFCLFSAGW